MGKPDPYGNWVIGRFRQETAGNHRNSEPPLVRRRAVSSGAEVEAVRAASVVRRVHCRGGASGSVGLIEWFVPAGPRVGWAERRRGGIADRDKPDETVKISSVEEGENL